MEVFVGGICERAETSLDHRINQICVFDVADRSHEGARRDKLQCVEGGNHRWVYCDVLMLLTS